MNIKYILFVLFTTINIFAMEGKEEQSPHPCPLAAIKFASRIKKDCRKFSLTDASKEKCIANAFEEFLVNCKKEHEQYRFKSL